MGILTALAYHIVGGLRHLVMDMGYWEELESGNQSARVAFVITAVLAVLAGCWYGNQFCNFRAQRCS